MSLKRDPEGREVQFLHELIDLEGASILEIGCGEGHVTWQYASNVARVTGIDLEVESLTEAMLDRPAQTATPVSFVAGNGDRLPFPDESFDVVLYTSSL